MGTTLQVQAADGAAEVYLAGEAGRPGVVFFVDAIGLRDRTREMADRIAGWGFTVLAPHVFYRDGSAVDLAPQGDLREDGAREEFFASGVMDRVQALTPDLSEPDSDAWLATLREHAAPGPVGTVGYCMGARLAVRLAGRFPDDVAAAAGFHGAALATDEPDSPHRVVERSRAEYVFGHADQDRSMPAEMVARLGETMADAGRPHLNEVYEGAAHGYSMADTGVYHEEAAERSFRELESLYRRTLSR